MQIASTPMACFQAFESIETISNLLDGIICCMCMNSKHVINLIRQFR